MVSSAKSERPILNNLIKQLRSNDTLVVWKLDRLGRSLKHLVSLVEQLMEKNIGLYSHNDPIDTTSSQGRLIFNMFASLAEFERDIIRERRQVGLHEVAAVEGPEAYQKQLKPPLVLQKRSIKRKNYPSEKFVRNSASKKVRFINIYATEMLRLVSIPLPQKTHEHFDLYIMSDYTQQTLINFGTLTQEDLEHIKRYRGDHNRFCLIPLLQKKTIIITNK